MIKIAFVVGSYPPAEQERRERLALSYTTAEMRVGIIRLEASPYVHGLSAADVAAIEPAYVEAYKQAEREGYDAAVPLGMLDLGVEAGRAQVSIPLVGPLEASLCLARLVGQTCGLTVYDGHLVPLIQRLVRRYGMDEYVSAILPIGIDLPDIAADTVTMTEAFFRVGHRLVDAGAEVIIPAGITQCPVHISADAAMERLGVPVVEGFGTPIRVAGVLAALHLAQKRWKPRDVASSLPERDSA